MSVYHPCGALLVTESSGDGPPMVLLTSFYTKGKNSGG